MFKVIASDGRVVGRVDSREMADAIVEMHKASTNDGKAMRAGCENASAAAKLTYTVEATK